jgi:hypothetical protein
MRHYQKPSSLVAAKKVVGGRAKHGHDISTLGGPAKHGHDISTPAAYLARTFSSEREAL